jgi:hypothetical protein
MHACALIPLTLFPTDPLISERVPALHDEMIKTEYIPLLLVFPSFQDDLLPNANYTETGISTTVSSFHFMLHLRLVSYRKIIHAMPSKAIGNKGIDASVFVASEVGPMAIE